MPQPTGYGDRPLRAPDSNPAIQGVDPFGLLRFMSVDSTGALNVNGSGTGGVVQPQIYDSNNSFTVTSASGTGTISGTYSLTRSIGVQRCLTILASNVSSGLGGTFEFQFSEDGVNATVDETRLITDFSTIRDFSLENFGAYYRIKFTPSRALTGSESVFVTTQFSTQYPGPFSRLASQALEEQNAAMGDTFAYLKLFDQVTGKSINIRPDSLGNLRVSNPLGLTGVQQSLVLNPSFEEGVAGVSSSSGFLQPSAVFAQTTTKSFIGSHSLQVTTTDGGGHAPGVTIACQPPFRGGQVYNLSVMVLGNTGGEILAVFLGDETSGDVAGPTIITASATTWQQALVTWTPSADRQTPIVVVRTMTSNQYYVDNIMVTRGPLPADYFDGDQFGSIWSGTPGNSVSVTGGALLPDVTGTWDYRAGISGTPRSFIGRVIGITAHATTAGSMTINGGDTVPIPANVGLQWQPIAQLVSPILVFTGTDGYVVEFVN